MTAIVHNYYIIESDGADNWTVYSGPSAQNPNIKRTFKSKDGDAKAKAILFAKFLP